MDKTQDRYGVFWYNEQQILHWTDEDFEAKAAEFAEAGINIVMTFSCTHFRWSFYPWFKEITAALAKAVRACHRYDIRVVEHHSSHLTHDPRSHREWQYVRNIFRTRQASLEMFPGLREHIASGDPEIRPGVHLSSCRQIDGRTGDFARTVYNGYGHCFNNPDFRQTYLNYLESVYAAGIDGIMTDDVQYFGNVNACACKYCREKFQKETGFELPGPADWGAFRGDYSNPAFVEWLRFRIRSTEEFHRLVNAHFQSLGLELLRPNYATTTFNCNQVAYPFEAAADLWTCIFQENMFSCVIRTAWPGWHNIAEHRFSLAKRHQVMAMSMFYPARYDDYYFCWALAKAWNHLLMASPEGGDLNAVEKLFSAYDKDNPVLENAVDFPDIAFLEPRSSLDLCPDPFRESSWAINVWLQSGLFRNLRFATVFEEDPVEEWRRYPFLLAVGANMLSDDQLEKLRQYCDRGGRLLVFGPFGIRRSDGSLREHPEKIFGLDAELTDFHSTSAGEFRWNGKTLELPATEKSRTFSRISGDFTVIAESGSGDILGISALGGRFIWLAGGIRFRKEATAQDDLQLSRWVEDPQPVPAQPYVADYLRDVPGAVLEVLLEKAPAISCSSTDFLATVFCSSGGDCAQIHLVNTAGVLPKDQELISHADLFVNFMPESKPYPKPVELVLNLPFAAKVSAAAAVSPEFQGAKKLPFQLEKNAFRITVPENTFAGYLKITLKLEK